MATLKQIDKRSRKSGMPIEDRELLIRAVSQLGDLVVYHGDREWFDSSEGYLKPDVLELLEELV